MVTTIPSSRTSTQDEAHSGRPIFVRIDKNISHIREIIAEDPHIFIKNLANSVGISTGAIHSIIHNDLKMRNVIPRWVPNALSEIQKKNRLRWLKNFSSNTKCDERRLFEIVAGDETLICYEEPKRKYQSAEMRAQGKPPPQSPNLIYIQEEYHTPSSLMRMGM